MIRHANLARQDAVYCAINFENFRVPNNKKSSDISYNDQPSLWYFPVHSTRRSKRCICCQWDIMLLADIVQLVLREVQVAFHLKMPVNFFPNFVMVHLTVLKSWILWRIRALLRDPTSYYSWGTARTPTCTLWIFVLADFWILSIWLMLKFDTPIAFASPFLCTPSIP